MSPFSLRKALLAGAALALVLGAPLGTSARADDTYPATLAGHAVMPAESFIEMPADAPADLKNAGKYTTGTRVEATGTVEGKSGGRPTGVSLPFKGQPRQGHSGIKMLADGTFWIVTDNGMGAKANSPDSALYLNRYRIDWAKGTFEPLQTVFLTDPDQQTLAVGLFGYVSEQTSTNWTIFAAGAVLAAVPVMVVFLALQRYIVNGLVSGSVK